MKFYVPIYVLIEAPSQQKAAEAKQAINGLLQNGFVGSYLRSAGVPYENYSVGDAIPVPMPQNQGGQR